MKKILTMIVCLILLTGCQKAKKTFIPTDFPYVYGQESEIVYTIECFGNTYELYTNENNDTLGIKCFSLEGNEAYLGTFLMELKVDDNIFNILGYWYSILQGDPALKMTIKDENLNENQMKQLKTYYDHRIQEWTDDTKYETEFTLIINNETYTDGYFLSQYLKDIFDKMHHHN